jgi:hypothetical protein
MTHVPDVYDTVGNNLRVDDAGVPDVDQSTTMAEAVA